MSKKKKNKITFEVKSRPPKDGHYDNLAKKIIQQREENSVPKDIIIVSNNGRLSMIKNVGEKSRDISD